MLRTLSSALVMAAATAIKLEAALELEGKDTKWTLNSKSWTADMTYVNKVLNDGNVAKFTDSAFPPNAKSLGTLAGDSAAHTTISAKDFSWKRLSDIYTPDKLTMFTKNQKWVTMKQGGLGSCYLLAVLAGMDNRPGVIENMFATKTVNSKGIYGMYLYMQGKKVVVHVDDFIPVKTKHLYGRKGTWPAFASSTIEGEVWPSIAEKVWAKVTGSYGNAEAGISSWAMEHLTNDPVTSYEVNGHGMSSAQFWSYAKAASDREYLQMLATNKSAWVPGHAYTLIGVREYALDGPDKPKTKLAQLRNPWGTTWWKGFPYAEGSNEYENLKAYWKKHGIKGEEANEKSGRFWMGWDQVLKQMNEYSIAWGQESRSGKDSLAEWHQNIRLNGGETKSAIELNVCEDIDLRRDILGIQIWQDGNLVGLNQDSNFKRWGTVTYEIHLTSADGMIDMTSNTSGAQKIQWDHTGHFVWNWQTSKDMIPSLQLPAGKYTLEITPGNLDTRGHKELEQYVLGLSSSRKVSMKFTQKIRGAPGSLLHKGKACHPSHNFDVPAGVKMNLQTVSDEARGLAAKGTECSTFIFSPTDPRVAWCCKAGAAFTYDGIDQGYNIPDYNAYKLSNVVKGTASAATNACANAPPTQKAVGNPKRPAPAADV